ncbi:hypothetical protein K661_03020, partial [Piscirickettsia salmonis LF-89 = ATCC VR-1361]
WTQESVMINESIYLARGTQHGNSSIQGNQHKLSVAERLQRLHEKRQREAND